MTCCPCTLPRVNPFPVDPNHNLSNHGEGARAWTIPYIGSSNRIRMRLLLSLWISKNHRPTGNRYSTQILYLILRSWQECRKTVEQLDGCTSKHLLNYTILWVYYEWLYNEWIYYERGILSYSFTISIRPKKKVSGQPPHPSQNKNRCQTAGK